MRSLNLSGSFVNEATFIFSRSTAIDASAKVGHWLDASSLQLELHFADLIESRGAKSREKTDWRVAARTDEARGVISG